MLVSLPVGAGVDCIELAAALGPCAAMRPPVRRPVAISALVTNLNMSIPEPMSRGWQGHFEVDQSIMLVFYRLPFRFERAESKYNPLLSNSIKLRLSLSERGKTGRRRCCDPRAQTCLSHSECLRPEGDRKS